MDDASRRLAALLAPLTNYERTRPDRPRFTLDTMRALIERIGPAARLRGMSIQVGGSKGKGTTAAYLEALGRAAGRRTGVYASPHVSSILERIRIDGRLVDEVVLDAACRDVIALGAGLDPAPSFFEVMTAAALVVFAAAGVELAVFEVGLGGRLDATTAIDVDASVLTGVELEHTELLGDTVEAIAGEKASIFRAGKIGVHACQGAAADVVAAHAARTGCTLSRPTATVVACEGGQVRVGLHGEGLDDAVVTLTDVPPWEPLALALAAQALRRLDPAFPIPATLERPRLPGRFEVHTEVDGAPLVLDGAHTEGSAAMLARALATRFGGERVVLLFASAHGKRWREALTNLLPIVESVVVTGITGTASEDPDRIADWLRAQGAAVERVADVAEGLARLRTRPNPRVVTGSFYLVGAVRDLVLGEGAPA